MADNTIDIAKLLNEISGTDLGKELMEVLRTEKILPKIETSKKLAPGTRGEYNKLTGTISIDPDIDLTGWGELSKSPKSGSTLAHELAHAADYIMAKQVYDNKKFPSYLGAQIKKFWSDGSIAAAQKTLASKLDEDSYRSSLDESVAFGVGNTIGPKLGYSPARPIAHLDATKAQEFAVQAELFLRALGKTRQ